MTARLLDLLTDTTGTTTPRTGTDQTMVAVGAVTDVSADGTVVTVSVLGSAPIPLPATASVWTGVATAHVLIDPATGRPVHVLGPAPAPLRPVGTVTTDTTETTTRTTTVTPTWSGTWSSAGGWDKWNTNRYGGRSDLYQGRRNDGQTLRGLAVYGHAVTSLGATAITHATLTVTGNGSGSTTTTVTAQCATWSATGPQTTGPTATGTCTPGRTTSIDATALAGGLLSGMGVALVGSGYIGVLGVGASMSLALTWRGAA